jgi:excisionase family DNA binding protein
MPKEILTAEEVAEYLRIHPYTVRRLAREGEIPGSRIGGQWRFKKKDIDLLIKSYKSKE